MLGLLRRVGLVWRAPSPPSALVLVEKCLEGGDDFGSGVGVGEVGQFRRLTRGEHLVEEALRVAPRTSVERGPQLANRQ